MEYIFLLGIGQGLLLTLFLLSKKENHLANRIFALTIFAYSLDIFNALIITKKLYLMYPILIGLGGPLPFFYSPSIFLYIIYVNRNFKSFRKKDYIHYIPAVIISVLCIYFMLFFDTASKLKIMDPSVPKDFSVIIGRTVIPFYGIFYTMLSLFEVKKYHKRLKQNFSDIEKLKLDWLIYLLIGIIIVWSFEFVQIILIELLSEPENIVFNYIYVVISVSMYAVAFKSLKQPEIFIQSYPLEKNIVEDAAASSGEDKNTSYKKSGLSDEKAALLINTLGTIMSTDKPYKTANLSLNDLAEMLSITPHNLSEIINTKLNKTFYDYISAYRVEEVKQLMKEDKNEVYSILSIALDAGFNSKSAFNNIFKKTTGITPSEYRKSLKN